MLGKILSLISIISLSLLVSACGSASYSDFDSVPSSWRGPSAKSSQHNGKWKKTDAAYFTERAIERADRF